MYELLHISQGANGIKMGSRGKSVIIFSGHYRWTKGILLNTKTHVASLGYGAVGFYEHLK